MEQTLEQRKNTYRDAGVTDLLARGSYEGSVIPIPLGGSQYEGSVMPFTSINSNVLQSSTTPNYQSPVETPVFPVSTIDILPPIQPTPQETQQSELLKRIGSTAESLVGESKYRAEQEQALGIPELTKTQNELSGRLTALKNEALAIPLQLQQESIGRGITREGLRPIETAALRNNAIQALSVNSLLEASRGNLATAQNLADRAVAQKYDPIIE